ncbi:MAG: hypothetical protein GC131_09265 [Alphaproteobacteria bacterium]|nr:hypothetical protein [Alphaproteobacteria bacterium]
MELVPPPLPAAPQTVLQTQSVTVLRPVQQVTPPISPRAIDPNDQSSRSNSTHTTAKDGHQPAHSGVGATPKRGQHIDVAI